MINIERSRPNREGHPLAQRGVLQGIEERVGPRQEIVGLATYMREVAAKPRGNATKGRADLNSHFEEYIIGENGVISVKSLRELQRELADALGVFDAHQVERGITTTTKVPLTDIIQSMADDESIGNPFHSVSKKTLLEKLHDGAEEISFGQGGWQTAPDGSASSVVAQYAFHYPDGNVEVIEHLQFRDNSYDDDRFVDPQTISIINPIQVLGVESISNQNQRVSAVVQGVDRDNPRSGFERPVVSEGPHMILAPYAFDENGELHVFRAIQMRTGRAVIDTPRGFADKEALETGQQMYDVEGAGEKVTGNMQRLLGEEAGEALQIKKIVFIGEPRVNGSFVTSKSAVFGVEVDYDNFIRSQKVITVEELGRREEQFEHEGLVGDILDMTLDQYIAYKQDSELDKDMAADFGTDTVVINFLEQQRKLLQGFQKTEPSVERALLHGEIALLVLKETEPEIYDAVTSEANRRLQQVTAREPQG